VPTGNAVSVKTVAKFVGFASPQFGFFPDGTGDLVSLFILSGDEYAVSGAGTIDPMVSGSWFTFGIKFGGSIYSSNPAANPVFPIITDHLVTYQVVGNEGHPANPIGSYVLGWEAGAANADNDYQDVVFEVSGITAVPEPTAVVFVTHVALILVVGCSRFGRLARSSFKTGG
jgi:hypothetical protein